MKLNPLSPQKSLGKDLLRYRPEETAFERFKTELLVLLSKIDEAEREDNQEVHIMNFLRDAFYKGKNEINKKGTIDIAIHLLDDKTSPVGVIVEAKRPKSLEMISVNKPNVKAMHELVLYFMRERVDSGNDDLRFLIATNINEWFIFKASDFNEHFYEDKKFRRDYEDWRDRKKVSTATDHFYNAIAKPFIDNLDKTLECACFDLKDYATPAGSNKLLVSLYKLLSPYHLLKVPFADDSNKLDKNFYTELLHIIGLEEVEEKSKHIIKRKKTDNTGSLIEMAMTMLESKDVLPRVRNIENYGNSADERYFNIALELCLTWVNRVLFLKLLEAQVVGYHEGNKSYKFLDTQTIPDFDELFALFHQVLAVLPAERKANISAKYGRVPYLNSSLFELSEIERQTITIESLKDHEELKVPNSSILKRTGETRAAIKTLEYLLAFLDAYDFASEGGDDIQKQNRPLINASVLGKVFEKINGYKDGSIYTPGFITMYMCHQAIRLAVVRKFKEQTDFDGSDFGELKNYIGYRYKKNDIVRYNEIVDSIKVCDPAAGSGHFLVSALNEFLAIKSELKIFADKNHNVFSHYDLGVANDELIVTDSENIPFSYQIRDGKPLNGEMQRLQETLFHEKQKIIENCLFGVDINPNSVKICRLRLWIELLKNAYYKNGSENTGNGTAELETLPNIDINIKEGNSLLSRFKIDNDLSEVLQHVDFSVDEYRTLVHSYKETRDHNTKRDLESKIRRIKDEFKTQLFYYSPERRDLAALKAQLADLEQKTFLFGEDEDKQKKRLKKIEGLKTDIEKQTVVVKAIEENVIYRNALEWRFEFPEVLNADGNFIGFDLVIGNPPYGVSITGDLRAKIVELHGNVPDYGIHYFFINLSHQILKKNGLESFIIPNSILFNVHARSYRENLFEHWNLLEIVDCTEFNIFYGAATVRNIITLFENHGGNSTTKVFYRPTAGTKSFEELISREISATDKANLLANNQNWGLIFKLNSSVLSVTQKIRNNRLKVADYFPEISQGLIAYDKYQGQSQEIINTRAYHSFEKRDGYKPWLWGEDVTRYEVKWNGKEYVDYCSGIANPREQKFFKGPRILVREITNPRIFAGFASDELYNDPAIINVIKPRNAKFSIKVLLGILNSMLATFYHFNSSPKATKGAFPKILVEDIKNFPLPELSIDKRNALEAIVDEILARKKASKPTEDLETQVDEIVYPLYDLTQDERAIIEGN